MKKLLKNISHLAPLLIIGLTLATGITLAATSPPWDTNKWWPTDDWAVDGATINAQEIAENFEYLKAEVDMLEEAVNAPSEYLAMASAQSATSYTHKDAATYCRNLSASAGLVYEGGSDATVYTDWYLPSTEEASLFEGLTSSTAHLWTSTTEGEYDNRWANIRLSDGHTSSGGTNAVRCVRKMMPVQAPSMVSAQSATSYTHKDAATYCRNLSASAGLVYEGGSDATVYTDWRIPALKEISIYIGVPSGGDYLWSTTQSGYGTTRNVVRLHDGAISNSNAASPKYVRCVR